MAEKEVIKFPLEIMMETTKNRMKTAFNQICTESNLPAYLIEGILADILADVRNQKNAELAAAYNTLNSEKKEGENKDV